MKLANPPIRTAPAADAEFEQDYGVYSKPMVFRVFKYFTVFILTIMVLLWLLQILFLQTFYQQMKIRELYDTAAQIESNYGEESFYDIITGLTIRSDMYIQIDSGDNILYASTSANPGDRMNAFAHKYDTEQMKHQLFSNRMEPVVAVRDINDGSKGQAMIYASVLNAQPGGDITYLFIFSPLSAVTSTVRILGMMLLLVTGIAIVISSILSIVMARRLSRPLKNINASALRLAEGDYSANFDGSGSAETEELAATLNYASEELSKADKLQKDLIANVTHDLKTPLTMVKSYAEMIRDISGNNPEKREKHLQVIISEADRLNSLVNDLTMLSKMQANVDALELTDFDLTAAARETLDSFAIHGEQDGFRFELKVNGNVTDGTAAEAAIVPAAGAAETSGTDAPAAGEKIMVRADEKKILQVFANLVGNAVRYSSDDKYVCISLEERGDLIHCSVIDHGQGIPAEELDSIWDRYYRSSRNQSRTSSGTGLGLSIVKQIFILHKAKYGVESKVGQGSCFWFDLKKGI